MRASAIGHVVRTSWARVRRLFADRRGSGDLTTYMLLTAAGAAMVGLTLPSLFSSSKSAANTFDNQVKVLERGANGGSSGGSGIGGSGSGSGWTFNVGKDGVSVSGPGGISGSVGSGGGSVSVGGGGSGGGSSGSSGSGGLNISGNAQTRLEQMEHNIAPKGTGLVN